MNDLCTSPFVTTPLDDPSIINASSDSENRVYATITVPWQVPGKLYSACEGLSQGTIFAAVSYTHLSVIIMLSLSSNRSDISSSTSLSLIHIFLSGKDICPSRQSLSVQ